MIASTEGWLSGLIPVTLYSDGDHFLREGKARLALAQTVERDAQTLGEQNDDRTGKHE
jgi:hypothetical protein